MVNWLGFCLIASTIFMLSVLTNGSIVTQRAPRLVPEPSEGVVSRLPSSTPPMDNGGNLSIGVNLEETSSSGKICPSRKYRNQ